jgi:hypothetical protein
MERSPVLSRSGAARSCAGGGCGVGRPREAGAATERAAGNQPGPKLCRSWLRLANLVRIRTKPAAEGKPPADMKKAPSVCGRRGFLPGALVSNVNSRHGDTGGVNGSFRRDPGASCRRPSVSAAAPRPHFQPG